MEKLNALYSSRLSFTVISTAPLIYINGQEVNTTDLIDNDADTCVGLPGSDGCSMDKVKIVTTLWLDKDLLTQVGNG